MLIMFLKVLASVITVATIVLIPLFQSCPHDEEMDEESSVYVYVKTRPPTQYQPVCQRTNRFCKR